MRNGTRGSFAEALGVQTLRISHACIPIPPIQDGLARLLDALFHPPRGILPRLAIPRILEEVRDDPAVLLIAPAGPVVLAPAHEVHEVVDDLRIDAHVTDHDLLVFGEVRRRLEGHPWLSRTIEALVVGLPELEA